MTYRRGSEADKARKGLDKGLRALFRALERRPVPGRIKSVVDQLETTAEPPKTA